MSWGLEIEHKWKLQMLHDTQKEAKPARLN